MNKINHALIMAAGRGLRMGPLTDAIPKAMAPYQGSTLIGKGINKIRKHIRNIHITVGYKGAMLAEHVIENDVSTIINTEGRGNCWWVFNSLLKYLNEPIFVLTCDNVIELDFEQFSENYYALGSPLCMVVPVKPVEGLEGDYIFCESNKVSKLTRTEESEKYCSGIQILNPWKVNKVMHATENFYDLWDELIKRKELYCSSIFPKKWYAVDTIRQLEEINKTIL
jgi:NDP-sugar pyrophosphorylase family protein|tara:strand:- start:453 stop:1127 length:675 start_codon:yes stop_codon:yes gene_type:complete